jgi:hypothetical protein
MRRTGLFEGIYGVVLIPEKKQQLQRTAQIMAAWLVLVDSADQTGLTRWAMRENPWACWSRAIAEFQFMK